MKRITNKKLNRHYEDTLPEAIFSVGLLRSETELAMTTKIKFSLQLLTHHQPVPCCLSSR